MNNSIFKMPTRRTRTTPTPKQIYDAGAADRPRKAAFAAMGRLKPKLEVAGSTPDVIWAGVKAEANKASRSDFTPKEWARTAARFNAALENPRLLKQLIEEYRNART